MAKVLKTANPIFGAADKRQKFFGEQTLEPGDEIYFVIGGMHTMMEVFIQGTNVADYMISTTDDTVAKCTALTAEYFDSEVADISADDTAEILADVTAVSVINRGTSTDDIIVLWRF